MSGELNYTSSRETENMHEYLSFHFLLYNIVHLCVKLFFILTNLESLSKFQFTLGQRKNTEPIQFACRIIT